MTHATSHQSNLWNGSSSDRVSRSATEYRILVMEQDTTVRRRYAEALIAVPPGAGVAYRIITVGSIAAAQLQAARQRFHLLIAALPSSHSRDEALTERLRGLYRSDISLLLLQNGTLDSAQFDWASSLGARLIERSVADEVLRATVAELLGLHTTSRMIQPAQEQGTRTPASDASGAERVRQRRVLDTLLEDAECQLAVYADANGHSVAQSGDEGGIDLAALVPLLASNFAHATQLGQALHDHATVHLSVHEASTYDVFVASAGDERIVALFFDKRSKPRLGYVWHLLKRCTHQLRGITG